MTRAKPTDSRTVVVVDGSADTPRRYPRALGRQPIDTVGRAREEACRVYRATTAGTISAKEGNALIFQLSAIIRMMEIEQIEVNIEAILRDRERQQRG